MYRVLIAGFALLCIATSCLAAQSTNTLGKEFPFPPPIQWRAHNWEVSVIGVAWGPANSPEMISKGYKERATNKPAFSQDRPYALAIKLRGYSPNTTTATMYGGSGLVMIKNVSGDFQVPLELTPTGFVRFSGSPGTMDMSFNRTNTTVFWDFFPVSPHQKAFLFQSFAFSAIPGSRGRPRVSFRVLIRRHDLVVVNAIPGNQSSCSDFTKNFSGTFGPRIKANLHLTLQGSVLSGTEQYVGIGKTLWLTGKVDSFGNFALKEHYPKHHVTGIFKGTFSRGCQIMSGYFSKPDGSGLLPTRFQAAQPAG